MRPDSASWLRNITQRLPERNFNCHALRGKRPSVPMGWFGCVFFLFKVQFSIALAVIFNLAQNQNPPANKKLVVLAELPWRRECQLGESEGKPDETYMNRREFDRGARYARFRRSPIASFGESTVNWRSETPNQGFRFFDGQFASSEKQRPMPHTRIQDELHGKRIDRRRRTSK